MKDEGLFGFFSALLRWWKLRPKRFECASCGRRLWICVDDLDAPMLCSQECVENEIGGPVENAGGYIPF